MNAPESWCAVHRVRFTRTCLVCQSEERDRSERPTGLRWTPPPDDTSTPQSRRMDNLLRDFAARREAKYLAAGLAVPGSVEEQEAIEASTAMSRRLAVEDRLPRHLRGRKLRRGYTPPPTREGQFA